jgi:iron complex outermembrane recepter protein
MFIGDAHKMFDRKLLLASTMIAGLVAFAPAMSFARDAAVATPNPAVPTTPPTPATDANAPAADNQVQELVITGSRIRRSEYTSPSPVQVITADQSTLEGLVDAAQVLQTSTVASNSQQINNTFTGFVVNGGPGVNTISLRGLGDQRTLVLLNGRRLPPAGVQGQVGAVDLNILPEAMIERYEILKDGASSIYGSDAVAGVVNVITKRDLDGGSITGDATVSEDGGGEEYSLSGAYGKVFDRGHVMISAEWFHREPLTMGDRDYLDCAQPYTFDPSTGERNDMIDFNTKQTKCISTSGNVVGYTPLYLRPEFGFGFYGSRVPVAVEGPRAPEDANLPPGWRFIPLDERNYNPKAENDTTVISPVDRYTVFADGSYDVGFGEAYGEFLFSRRESSQKQYQTIFQFVAADAPCSVNPFSCPDSPNPGVFNPETLFITPLEADQTVNVYRGLAGLRGDFKNSFLQGWNWDAYVSYSASRGKYFTTGIYNDRVAAVTGTDDNFQFTQICGPGSFAGCTAVNFFSNEILSAGSLPSNILSMLQIRETGETKYNQAIAEAQITGDLFKLPAGPVGAAFGVAIRHDELDDQPGPEAVAGNYWGLATAGPTKGDDTLKEVYGEVEVPIARGASFAEELTLNLSGRYSDYDSYGASSTYKVGVNWRLSNELRLRYTHGTSFRAPALFEQFLNNQTAFLPQASVDPCIRWGESSNPAIRANCAADGLPPDFGGGGPSAQLLIGGGKDLKAEESTASSFGIVITPEAFDFNFAVDYWEIEINNEVTSLAAAVVGQCYASPNFPSSEFCGLFDRNAGGNRDITFIDASYRNITSQTSRGIDFSARYTRDIGPGKLTWDGEATYKLEDTLELFAGNTDDFRGLIGQPEWVGQSRLKYKWRDWTFALTSDYIGHQSNSGYQFGATCDLDGNYAFAGSGGFAPYCAKNHAEAVWYHHVSVRYDASTWSVTAGVRNAFNELPPFASDPLRDKGLFTYGRLGMTNGSTQNDYVGRRFFVSLTKNF